MHLNTGSFLQGEKYRIESVLGQGSFGITYLATTKFRGQLGEISVKVAIKEFFARDLNLRHPDGSVAETSSESLSRKYAKDFKKEAKNLSSLKHPNIINVLETFSENNTYYYVMEYLDGGNLDDHIQHKGKLNESEALGIASQMASALSYMHSNNMLHLDLKPKNVMLRSDGTICLIDFGLSKQYESNGDPESSTTIGLGTPGYAPLEQHGCHERKDFAPTLDIYALGASIFKMLTGKTPPRASDIMNNGFPSEELEYLNINPVTIAQIKKMMSPRRNDRPLKIKDCIPTVFKAQSNITMATHSDTTEVLNEEIHATRTNKNLIEPDKCIPKKESDAWNMMAEIKEKWPFISAMAYYLIICLFWMWSGSNYSSISYFVLTNGLAALSVFLLSYGKLRIGLYLQVILFINFALIRIIEPSVQYQELNSYQWEIYNNKYTGLHVIDLMAAFPLCLSMVGICLKGQDNVSFWHNMKSAPKKKIVKFIAACTIIAIAGCFAVLPLEQGWAGTHIIHELKDYMVITVSRFI